MKKKRKTINIEERKKKKEKNYPLTKIEMPLNANVIIEYGPYNSNGIVEYRLERLTGLQSII